MTTVDEYLKMVEEAQQDSAHVAVLTYYRSAIEETGYCPDAAPILLAAVKYAQLLKKDRDRKAIARWSQEMTQKVTKNDLAETINQEISKLQELGVKNATA